MLNLPRKVKLIISFSILCGFTGFQNDEQVDWPEYLGGPDRNHYSPLTQINASNAKDLQVAWTYALPDSGQMQANPITVNGKLYSVSASVQAFALDAATGKEIWRFGDPLKNWASTSRGLSYADERILYTAGPNLWALDAKTGKPIETFGDQGKVDLHTGLPEIAKDKFIISNTPGTIVGDLIVMPLRLSEGADAAPGDIRAFNIYTGKLVWSFHTIPYPGEKGYSTFPKDAHQNTYTGAANNWAGMAVDRKRGIIYVPTGSAGYDFWGGNRKGQNLYANCLLALDAKTGKLIWHFQTTHHDIWDRDLPAPPNLITVTRKRKRIDAVAQITKQGFVFIFDRVTGKPLFPIQERKVNTTALLGEQAWKTQPFPLLPKPYARLSNEIQASDLSPYAKNKKDLMNQLANLKRGWYDAPSEQGTLILPGFDGGGEWGGAGADPEKGILYINSNEMGWIQKMVKNKQAKQMTGEGLYQQYCANCHGSDRKGNPASGYPSLFGIEKKRESKFIVQMIKQGKGMMPGFGHITSEGQQAIASYIQGLAPKEVLAQNSQTLIPYQMSGYNKFLDQDGLPALSTPWGTLNAIDMNTGKYLWKIPFGQEPELVKQGVTDTGGENYGGPIITKSGLLIIAATKDATLRIYQTSTGNLLASHRLPFASFATPSTYMVNGKQYIVVTCGGTKLGTAKGNVVVAFSVKSEE
ncbi:outer membrane protein assembly factor BamB family protein [Aquirufa regiilacus]|uniref:PQQ-binding-like beta-propeller repeat protein n=1 Tax=Aquirufa regiilacus TaxID=3024868 RepID=A0ABU3TQZ2_9BACT|nr:MULTISPECIES: PQQ-binding-like beta-propeller repeat protein [unclassified Aquirufa]MDT8886744.1 PQQ-binding-like beta-propeller repeat protein [Aquirufa sp. LEPPI-3A]MDU0808291.1 PQQ-binding-like beta-propeller repeat protein [Aquirufa sp. LEOWEIH-7C]